MANQCETRSEEALVQFTLVTILTLTALDIANYAH